MSLSVALAPDTPEAETITGSDDPAFRETVALWLQDDEAVALPALAGMAAGGNSAAQLLLGLIDKTASLQGPWLTLRGKPERLALLRDTGGLSGTSWLRRNPGSAVAMAWAAVLDQRAGIADVLEFADLGEARALRVGLIALEARQVTGFDAFEDDPRYPRRLRYLVWRDWQKGGEAARLARDLATIDPADPQRSMIEDTGAGGDLGAWLAASDVAQPLQSLCRLECETAFASCLAAGFDAIGGYRRVLTLGTPAASLIPEAEFAASPRGRASVLRRALAYAFLTPARRDEIAAKDACFADLLVDEGQRF